MVFPLAHRRDDIIEFTFATDRHDTSVTYVLSTAGAPPDDDEATALRRRSSELIGNDLRRSYGN